MGTCHNLAITDSSYFFKKQTILAIIDSFYYGTQYDYSVLENPNNWGLFAYQFESLKEY